MKNNNKFYKNKNLQTGFGDFNQNNFHKAKKSLGQNFLKSKEAIRAICDAGKVEKGDAVIEIGPGKGVLTEELLKRGANVLAIEKDHDLIEFLEKKFENILKISKPGLEILEEDCLNFNPDKYFKNNPKYKIIANIPYNITGAIIKKFLGESKNKPILMALLVQKEVAERIVARNQSKPGLNGKESILSLSVKAYGEPKYIMKVSKKYFSPAPKVDSAIILIDNIANKNFKNNSEEKVFFDIVHAGFGHKRKIFIKNIEFLNYPKEKIEKMFEVLKIDKKSRAEDIPFYKWMEIKEFLIKEN